MPAKTCRIALSTFVGKGSRTLTRVGIVSAILLSTPLVTSAEQVLIPIGQASAVTAGEIPRRGDTAAVVSSRFGEALKRTASVGSPPIMRWDYPTFSVYFEQGRVLHAVLRRNPQQG